MFYFQKIIFHTSINDTDAQTLKNLRYVKFCNVVLSIVNAKLKVVIICTSWWRHFCSACGVSDRQWGATFSPVLHHLERQACWMARQHRELRPLYCIRSSFFLVHWPKLAEFSIYVPWNTGYKGGYIKKSLSAQLNLGSTRKWTLSKFNILYLNFKANDNACLTGVEK